MANPAHTRAVGQLLAAALLWSLGGLLIKSVNWPPLAVAAGRGLLAAAVLAVTHRGLKFHWSALQLGAAGAYAICTVTFVAATKLTTAANAILLQYTAPVWVGLFGAWLLGERATRGDWLAIAAALGGMALFFADRLQLAGLLGNLLAISSGMAFAGVAMLLRMQKHGSPVESVILGNLLAAAIGLPALVRATPLAVDGWLALVALGVVQLGLPWGLYARAIKQVTALEGVLIPILEPVLNPVWVLLFLGERPGRWALAGGVVVLAAVTWRAWRSVRRAGVGLAPAPCQASGHRPHPASPA